MIYKCVCNKDNDKKIYIAISTNVQIMQNPTCVLFSCLCCINTRKICFWFAARQTCIYHQCWDKQRAERSHPFIFFRSSLFLPPYLSCELQDAWLWCRCCLTYFKWSTCNPPNKKKKMRTAEENRGNTTILLQWAVLWILTLSCVT